MVNAVSNSVVPKFTVIVGNSMVLEICDVWKSIRPRFAWPSAELAVMGGTQAAKYWRKLKLLQKKAVKSSMKKKALFDKIKARYDEQVSLCCFQIVD
jgi:acetyl-CoA carboxylase carboxyltransferase component